MTGIISVKCLQSRKLKVKCYSCFTLREKCPNTEFFHTFHSVINLKFSKSTRKTCDDCPSARISKPKELNIFNIFMLPTRYAIACAMPFLLYFYNHIEVFFEGLLELSVFQLFPICKLKNV